MKFLKQLGTVLLAFLIGAPVNAVVQHLRVRAFGGEIDDALGFATTAVLWILLTFIAMNMTGVRPDD